MNFQTGRGVRDSERIVELGQRSTGKMHHSHYGAFQSAPGRTLLRRPGENIFDLVLQHKTQGVGVVNSSIEDYATTRRRAVQTPALESRR